jgi:tetratricopeptide (TPR) repeat protein
VIALAAAEGFSCYSGECQSYGTNSAYLVWQPIWRAYFGLQAGAPVAEQIAQARRALAAIDPSLLPRLPLLGSVLDLPIPENELTAGLDQQLRKSSCEALLVDCLKARGRGAGAPGLLLVLEDAHWLDPLSHDLLEALSQAIPGLPVLIVLAYRPPELARLQRPRVMVLPHATSISLGELSAAETEQLIDYKLRQHGLLADGTLPPRDLVQRLAAHGEGNPFYVEELLNFLLAQGLDLAKPASWAEVALPASLHSLILSRLDQLGERQRTMLRVASIIGRIFRVAWLCGYYPSVGTPERVTAEMETLCRLELTLREFCETTSSYLFKHVITQVVTYESLAYATRATLHEQFARFLEREAETGPPLDLLAYHYTRSANLQKQREYLRRAGDAAEASYANEAALEYYEQLLPLIAAPAEQIAVLVKLVTVLERVGRWEQATARAQQAHALAQALGDRQVEARCALALGTVASARGEHTAARRWLNHAIVDGDLAVQIAARITLGLVATDQGAFGEAMAHLREALRLNAARGDGLQSSRILSKLSWIAFMQGEFVEMRELADAAVKEAHWVGSISAEAEALRRLGMADVSRHAYAPAREATAKALELYRSMGDREGIAATLHNMGQIYRVQHDYPQAIRYCDEGLALFRELGGWRHLAMCLYTRGLIAYLQGELEGAAQLLGEGLEMAHTTGTRWVIAACQQALALVALATGHPEEAQRHCRRALEEATAIGVQSIALWTLAGYGWFWIDAGRAEAAAELIGLILAHPAGGSDAPLYARTVLDRLKAALVPETLEAALARGRELQLDAVVATLLGAG